MNSEKKKTIDMTVGKPLPLLLSFAFPILLGSIFQVLYNMVDSMIVGKFVSSEALAAVGTCTSPYNLLVNLNMGTATGVGILAAQYFGAKRDKDIRPLITNAFIVMTVTSLVISGFGFVLSPQLLKLLGTPEEVLTDASTYLRLIFLSMLGSAYYNITASVLRALGDSKTPLYFLILSSVLNTVLDIVLVTVFDMGVFGVAFATVVSQYVVTVLTLIYARKKFSYFQFGMKELKLNKKVVRQILRAGIPLALQQSTISLSALILQRFINSFGAAVMAAHTAAGRWNNIINMFFSSFAAATSTFVGQNIGAKKLERIKEVYRLFWGLVVVFCALILGLVFILDKPFMGLFTNDEEVIEIGVSAMRVYSFFAICLGNLYIHRAIINGSGDATYAMLGGFMEVISRVGIAVLLIFVFHVGRDSIWYAITGCWTFTGIFFLCRFLSGKWKTKSFA